MTLIFPKEWPMKKLLTSTLVISSLILAPALRADTPSTEANTDTPTEEVQTAQESTPADETATDEGTPVSQASDDTNRKTAKRKRWQNILLAVSAVAIAITALILVANNDGHKGHHHHGH
jgi:hypothetical protein